MSSGICVLGVCLGQGALRRNGKDLGAASPAARNSRRPAETCLFLVAFSVPGTALVRRGCEYLSN